MKKIVFLVAALLGTLVLAMPAEASASGKVTVLTPTAHQVGKALVVSGKVRGAARSVRIQQRKSGRWAVVRVAKVTKGSYHASLAQSAAVTQVRATAAGAVSKPVTVAATPTADACGALIKKADGTYWTCTFDDEFNGTTLDRSVWAPQTEFAMGTQAAHDCAIDDPSTVNVSGGSLNLSLRKVSTPVSCSFGGLTGATSYVSGGVSSYHTFSQEYGRFEARIKNTATTFPGLQETFWLWPDDRVKQTTIWPFAGEMDVSETYSSYPTLSIPFLHYNAAGPLPGVNTAWTCTAPRGQWNTYAEEWSPTTVQIFVNGKSCLTNTSRSVAFNKPYIVAFSQGLGAAGDVYDGRAPLGTMSVDYVKAWK
ncbi:MAG TPA: glycoside hydrolase family 16 protein [Marmoricola sp.]|jgi:beta-glucanase (GH16 family)|nr:glycoside hydrolase family 16 protein [Marmoricola sp.]